VSEDDRVGRLTGVLMGILTDRLSTLHQSMAEIKERVIKKNSKPKEGE